MSKHSKNYTLILLVITLISCSATKITDSKSTTYLGVNTILNTESINSRKAFSGKLNSSLYNELKSTIEKELNTKIPEGKSIIINFHQEAANCIPLSLSNLDYSKYTSRSIQNSLRISEKYNTVSYFVFTENAFHKDLYLETKNFKLDSGFFYNSVFKLHENCEAFLIIKPNGDFLKYYGSDYYNEVVGFLKKESLKLSANAADL